MTTPPTASSAATPPSPLRDLTRAAAGPVVCAIVLTGLLSAWAGSGGAGTLSRLRLQITLAAIPMRAFTPQAAADTKTATTFLTIRNLSATPDKLTAVSTPIAPHVILTRRDGPSSSRTQVTGLTVPGHATLTLTPFTGDAVLQDPAPYERLATVPLTLTFQHSGSITISAPVTPPGTP
jgi:copper(I)-binding protein